MGPCQSCSQTIENESVFCRFCGARQTPINPVSQAPAQSAPEDHQAKWATSTLVLIIALAIFAGMVVFDMVSTSSSTDSRTSTTVDATNSASEAAMAATDAAGAIDPSPSHAAERWTYSTDEDKVRGATTNYASTTSTNTVVQGPPYSAATTMEIMLRKSQAFGTDVILTISSGQMMCPSYRGCSATVRFDDGKPQTIQLAGPEDNSSEIVFVRGAKSLIEKLKASKHVVIEKTLYQAGNPQFEFNTSGLKWDH